MIFVARSSETDEHPKDVYASFFKSSGKYLTFRKSRENYKKLYRELVALHHQADADDLQETINEINETTEKRTRLEKKHREKVLKSVYGTLGHAIGVYKKGELNDQQFGNILYEARERLSRSLHKLSPEELRKKKPGEMRLTDIVHKEMMRQAAAILAFALGVLSFDQVRVTGMTVSSVTGSYDYYSLFGFLFLALATLLFLMRKDN